MVKRKNKFAVAADQEEHMQTDYAHIFPQKVSLESIRKIWNDKVTQYTDEQLYKIREWIYAMAGVIIDIAEKRKLTKRKTIKLKHKSNETEEGDNIHPGKYRRAG